MNPNTTTLFNLFLIVRDGLRTAIGERRRLFSSQLFEAMLIRWQRLTRPAIRIFQALLAGTYRPRAPRQPAPRGAAPPRAQRPPQLEQMTDKYWIVHLLPADYGYRYCAGFAAGSLQLMLDHPGLPELLAEAPTLGFHLRRLCRRFNCAPPDCLRAPAKAEPPPAPAPEPMPEPMREPVPEPVSGQAAESPQRPSAAPSALPRDPPKGPENFEKIA